jgi:hypothetical protein
MAKTRDERDTAIAQARSYLERYLLGHPDQCLCVLCEVTRAWLVGNPVYFPDGHSHKRMHLVEVADGSFKWFDQSGQPCPAHD